MRAGISNFSVAAADRSRAGPGREPVPRASRLHLDRACQSRRRRRARARDTARPLAARRSRRSRCPRRDSAFPAGAAVTLAGFGKQTPTASEQRPARLADRDGRPAGRLRRLPNDGLIEFNAIELCEASPIERRLQRRQRRRARHDRRIDTDAHRRRERRRPGMRRRQPLPLHLHGSARDPLVHPGERPAGHAPRARDRTASTSAGEAPLVVGNTLDCEPGDWPDSNATYAYSFVNTANGQVLQPARPPSSRSRRPPTAPRSCARSRHERGRHLARRDDARRPPVKAAPQARDARRPALGARGRPAPVVTLAPPRALRKFSVCIDAAAAAAGALPLDHEHRRRRGQGAVHLQFRVKPTARAGTDSLRSRRCRALVGDELGAAPDFLDEVAHEIVCFGACQPSVGRSCIRTREIVELLI